MSDSPDPRAFYAVVWRGNQQVKMMFQSPPFTTEQLGESLQTAFHDTETAESANAGERTFSQAVHERGFNDVAEHFGELNG